MRIKIIFILSLMLTSYTLSAQSSDKLKALKLSSFGIQGSMGTIYDNYYNYYYYHNPVYDFIDLSSYNIGKYHLDDNQIEDQSDVGLKCFANFKMFDKNTNAFKSNRELQLGLSYNYSSGYFALFDSNEIHQDDTIDSTPGHLVFHDSSIYNDKDFYIFYNLIGLNVGYNYFTKPVDGLSLFVMPGIDVNFSIINRCDYINIESTNQLTGYDASINSNGDTTRIQYYFGSHEEHSFIKIPGSLFLRPNVTFGFTYQLPIIHPVHLFFGFKTAHDFHFSQFRLINSAPVNNIVTGIIYKF